MPHLPPKYINDFRLKPYLDERGLTRWKVQERGVLGLYWTLLRDVATPAIFDTEHKAEAWLDAMIAGRREKRLRRNHLKGTLQPRYLVRSW